MPLQNRADPLGHLHANHHRGTLMGNRGIIHDPKTKTLLSRGWTHKAWIICACDFKQRERDVFGRNGPNGSTGWSELFFLDEVTALAAGHRPCFYCRRKTALLYNGAVACAFGVKNIKAPEIDTLLHQQRYLSGKKGERFIDIADVIQLPDGAMIHTNEEFYACHQGTLLQWSFGGYCARVMPATLKDQHIKVITPMVSLSALEHGFKPLWHKSAVQT